MSFFRLLFWLIFIATLAIYVTMLAGPLSAIQEATGGLPAFDVRPMGYTFEDAMLFLSHLPDDARALYLGQQHTLDMFFPLGIALSKAIAIFTLLPAARVWKWLLALLPVPGMIFDYMENAAVSVLLKTPTPDVVPDMVTTASRYTVLKSLFDTASFIVLFAVLIAWIISRLRARRQTSVNLR